ncbi:MAG: sigma 54-interacting transcriptional regulator [Streptococcaceae bacterium]|nr:sigma 54-interacting transcriptional regulator [Streptococcaceae bacterium]
MNQKKDIVLDYLKHKENSASAMDVAEAINISRTQASRYLAELSKDGAVIRIEGRPVLYQYRQIEDKTQEVVVNSFHNLIGAADSLKLCIEQAKAAVVYPPNGLHTVIFGESGTGKSLFAECMYQYALEHGRINEDIPFITFNCADYAQNPQLLYAHVFGVKKGAYTGAEEDRLGLVHEANGGILFLDEIHRLPPEGQEMMFTFIDRGIYRPLGESTETQTATVQIIGATTEDSESLLTTFNRRIPMSITLPPLRERSIEERFALVASFVQREATQLGQSIYFERDAFLSFLLYPTKGNIGQIKKDVKLVCARAFLNFRSEEMKQIIVKQAGLPFEIQQGLLNAKKNFSRIQGLGLKQEQDMLEFSPDMTELLIPNKNVGLSSELISGSSHASTAFVESFLDNIKLQDFHKYIEVLTSQELRYIDVPAKVKQLAEQIYACAEGKLNRQFSEASLFAFTLHLQSVIERTELGKAIHFPDLNIIRREYPAEFQVALECSSMIENAFELVLPFDEIGFLTKFLITDLEDLSQTTKHQVKIIVVMHGKSTASSMLEAAQELTLCSEGVAFNMPLTMEVQEMYREIKTYLTNLEDNLDDGVLLLTDMGSLNSFSTILQEELGIRARAIPLVSTLVLMEAIRLANNGRLLEDIYQKIQQAYESAVATQFSKNTHLAKAVIVACFTGEGVAQKLYDRIAPVVNQDKVKIIQLQFLEKETFKRHIDELRATYQITAIVGTVPIDYQNIPFFSAFDIFFDRELEVFQRIVADDLPLEQMVDRLTGVLTSVGSVADLLKELSFSLTAIEKQLQVVVDPDINLGILLHLAFLIDGLIASNPGRNFDDLDNYVMTKRYEMDTVRVNLMTLEKKYHVEISEDEIAYITQMIIENAVNHR